MNTVHSATGRRGREGCPMNQSAAPIHAPLSTVTGGETPIRTFHEDFTNTSRAASENKKNCRDDFKAA